MLEFMIAILIVIAMTLTTIISVDIANAPRLKQIAQCEKELPRNQKCVLIAVPEKDNDSTSI